MTASVRPFRSPAIFTDVGNWVFQFRRAAHIDRMLIDCEDDDYIKTVVYCGTTLLENVPARLYSIARPLAECAVHWPLFIEDTELRIKTTEGVRSITFDGETQWVPGHG